MHRLFHGKALRFMAGMKSEYNDGSRGERNPQNSFINFAVPCQKRVATYEPVGVNLPNEIKPGVVIEAIELKSEDKSYIHVLSFDGKKTCSWTEQRLG